MEQLRYRNEELSESLMNKNEELEQAYKRLQSEMRGGGSHIRGSEESIDKLEDGLKEAIASNFQILRESALSELRQYLQ